VLYKAYPQSNLVKGNDNDDDEEEGKKGPGLGKKRGKKEEKEEVVEEEELKDGAIQIKYLFTFESELTAGR